MDNITLIKVTLLKRLYRLFFFVFSLLLIAHTLPYIARDLVVYGMLSQGADFAQIKALRVNWLTGRITVDRLSATADDRKPLSIGRLVLDVDLAELWHSRILVEQLAIQDADLNVQLTGKHLLVGPLSLPLGEPTSEPESDVVVDHEQTPSNWQFGVRRLEFSRLGGEFKLQNSPIDWRIEDLTLDDVRQWQRQDQTKVTLVGSVNGADVNVSTQGALLLEDQPIRVETELTLKALSLTDLSQFQPIAEALPFPLSGVVSSDLTVSADVSLTEDRVSIATSGGIQWQDAVLNMGEQKAQWKAVSWQGDSQTSVVLDQSLSQVLTGKLVVDQAQFLEPATATNLAVDTLAFSGSHQVDLALNTEEQLNIQPKVKSDFLIDLTKLVVEQAQSQPLAASLEQLHMKGALSLGDKSESDVVLQGLINLTGVGAKLGSEGDKDYVSARLERAHWQGEVDILPIEQDVQHLRLKGDLDLQALGVDQGDLHLGLSNFNATHTLDIGNLSQPIEKLAAQTRLDLKGISYSDQSTQVTLKSFDTRASVNTDNTALVAAWVEPIRLKELLLSVSLPTGAESELKLDSAELASAELLNEQVSRFTLGELSFNGLTASATDSVQQAKGDVATVAKVTLPSVVVDNLPLLDLNKLNEVTLEHADIAVAQLVVDDLALWLTRNADGDIWPVSLFAVDEPSGDDGLTVDATSNETVSSAANAGDQPLAPIAKSLVLGGVQLNNATMSWVDEAESNSQKIDLTLLLTLLDIGELRPLESTQKTPIELNALLNEYANIRMTGNSLLVDPVTASDWDIEVKGVELPSLNGYVEPASGYYIQQGQLGLVSKGSLVDEQVSSKNTVLLRQVKVNQRNASKAREMTSSLTMPLETVIVLLQDSDRVIDLDVPVNGALADLNFGLQGVLNKVVQLAVKQAALNYLSNALQPYGALVFLTQTALNANKNGAFINLKPIEFAATVAALNAQNKAYLDTVTKMMAEKTSLVLKMCPSVGKQDVAAFEKAFAADRDAQLAALAANTESAATGTPEAETKAQPVAAIKPVSERVAVLTAARSKAVKAYLAESLSAERLFSCFDPESDQARQTVGIVELGF